MLRNFYIHLLFGIGSGLFAGVSSAQGQTIVEESLAAKMTSTARIGLSPFRYGFAAIQAGEDRYYIDSKGERIRLLNDAVFGGLEQYYSSDEQQREQQPQALPKRVLLFEKEGLRGVLSLAGELLVPAMYDHIETEYRQFWKLYQGSKKTFFLPDGHTLPLFDEIGYLDGEYFDVKQNGTWHLYSKSRDKIITADTYEGFDFCGGCATPASYVYAKKDGKWGIIDWDENILVPFAFEHEHRIMRNDHWVQSFSQDGRPVIVHIPTQQVFDATSPHTAIISGMLVTTENGRYGAYDRNGKLAVPFEFDELVAPNANSYLGYYGHYLIAKKENKKGVIKADGSVILPLEYDDISVYDDFFVTKKNAQTSLWRDGSGAPLIQREHVEMSHVNDYYYSSGSQGLPVFKIKQKAYYGLYFANNNRFYEPIFYDISLRPGSFRENEDIIEGEKQGLKTLFDITGENLLPFEVQDYSTFEVHNKSLLAIKIRGKWGLYDLEEDKEIVPTRYDQYFKLLDSATTPFIQTFADGFKGIDLYDLQGSKWNDTTWNRIEAINHRYYLVEYGKAGDLQYAVFDADQKTTEKLRYPHVAILRGTEELLMVSHNGFQGKLYDFKNGLELKRWYNVYMFAIDTAVPEDSAHWLFFGFQNGYAKVQSKEGMVGYIDEQGEVIIPPRYAWARVCGKDRLLVSDGSYVNGVPIAYIIDGKGKHIFPAGYGVDIAFYNTVDNFDMDHNIILWKENINGAFTAGLGDLRTGEILIPAIYDELRVSSVDSSYIILSKQVDTGTTDRRNREQKFGLATTDGKIILEASFDDIYQPRFPFHMFNQKKESLFPLLVSHHGKWRYINGDGQYLPIKGDYVSE